MSQSIRIFKVFRALYKTISAIVYYVITLLIPKDNNLWVFGSWKGKSYSDNSKEMFEYMISNHPEIKVVWIAKNDIIYKELLKKGLPVVRYSTLRGKWSVARAAANFQTESNEDTGLYKVGGTKVIQLFHGSGAIKEAYLYAGMGWLKKLLVKIYSDNHSTSYWMVASDYYVMRYPILCECNPKKIKVTGQPRTDLLLRRNKVEFFENFRQEHPKSKIIIYTPTHRNYALNDKVYMSESSWNDLNDFLHVNEIFMFFKPHPLELPKYIDTFKCYSNIILVSNNSIEETSDIYEYVHYFDMLISDYSSISSDFLPLDKPIIHYMYDLETFEDTIFKLNALDKFVAGPIVKSIDELKLAIIKGLETDDYRNVRYSAARIAYKYNDSQNCERVYEAVLSILNMKNEKN